MSDNNFINSVKFNKNFPPFKGGDEIVFGGEKEMQDLIEFYLKSKGVKNYKKNSERFKINCILGNNGVGKSRLFEGVFLEKEKKVNDIIKTSSKSNENSLFDYYSLFNNNFSSQDALYLRDINEFFFNFVTNSDYLENFTFFEGKKVNYFQGNLKFVEGKKDNQIYIVKEILLFLNKKDTRYEHFFSNSRDLLESTFKKPFALDLIIRDHLMINYEFFEDATKRNSLEIVIDIIELFFSLIGKKGLKKLTINQNMSFDENKDIIQNFWEKYYSKEKNISKKLSGGTIFKIELDKCTKLERQFFMDSIIKFNLIFSDGTSFAQLSGGEKSTFIRFASVYLEVMKKSNDKNGEKNFRVFIDEPDLHLHLEWQKKYIKKLIDVFSNLPEKVHIHFIIATHSPFIISDLPSECLILLDKNEGDTFTKIKKYDGKTFGANFVDLIRDGFFFKEEALMGGFAENVIGKMADDERKSIIDGDLQINKLKENIGDDFLRDNLLYFKKDNND